MSKLVHSLNIEHRRMVKLLTMMEREIERFREGNVLDFLLISSILDYLMGVGQYKLHMAEDEIYKLLRKKDPEGSAALGDVPMEHEKLSFLCDTLCQAVKNIEQDSELPRMWLVSVATEFCNAMRRHLELEDKEFFPLALQKLSKEDWTSIEELVAKHSDPDVEHMESEALHDLRDEIISWGKDQPLI